MYLVWAVCGIENWGRGCFRLTCFAVLTLYVGTLIALYSSKQQAQFAVMSPFFFTYSTVKNGVNMLQSLCIFTLFEKNDPIITEKGNHMIIFGGKNNCDWRISRVSLYCNVTVFCNENESVNSRNRKKTNICSGKTLVWPQQLCYIAKQFFFTVLRLENWSELARWTNSTHSIYSQPIRNHSSVGWFKSSTANLCNDFTLSATPLFFLSVKWFTKFSL